MSVNTVRQELFLKYLKSAGKKKKKKKEHMLDSNCFLYRSSTHGRRHVLEDKKQRTKYKMTE